MYAMSANPLPLHYNISVEEVPMQSDIIAISSSQPPTS
jgi:hypothetical protein